MLGIPTRSWLKYLQLILEVKPTRVLPIPTCGEDSETWVGVLAEVFAADIGRWKAARNYRKINPVLV